MPTGNVPWAVLRGFSCVLSTRRYFSGVFVLFWAGVPPGEPGRQGPRDLLEHIHMFHSCWLVALLAGRLHGAAACGGCWLD